MRSIITALATILIIAVTLAAFGRGALERTWALFGPADLGPVVFETLERRTTPNDALACPPGLCRARNDVTPPVFAIGVEALKAAMARVIASEPDVTMVEDMPLGERYIQRTKWMRFPDTITIRYIARGDQQSAIALYSRSQLGRGDLGVNKARVRRWLDKLSAEAPVTR